jgi:hypothetical protein
MYNKNGLRYRIYFEIFFYFKLKMMYCGNNALYTGLINGTSVLGTRYKCLRRGIGIGRRLPFDPIYLEPYAPLFVDKIYCGSSPTLPQGYSRFGSLYDCHRAGVAVGKKITAEDVSGTRTGYLRRSRSRRSRSRKRRSRSRRSRSRRSRSQKRKTRRTRRNK